MHLMLLLMLMLKGGRIYFDASDADADADIDADAERGKYSDSSNADDLSWGIN